MGILEYALALVGDVRKNDNEHNYRDLLTFNPLFHGNLFLGSSDRLDDLKDALASGGNDAAKRIIAEDLVASIGVNTIVSKASGGVGHGGGVRLASGSQALQDLETFLNLL